MNYTYVVDGNIASVVSVNLPVRVMYVCCPCPQTT